MRPLHGLAFSFRPRDEGLVCGCQLHQNLRGRIFCRPDPRNSAQDGAFDSEVESIAPVDFNTGLAVGPHLIGIRYKDDNNTWGEGPLPNHSRLRRQSIRRRIQWPTDGTVELGANKHMEAFRSKLWEWSTRQAAARVCMIGILTMLLTESMTSVPGTPPTIIGSTYGSDA